MRISEKGTIASLRRHGYKLTPQRRVIIQALAATQDHLTPAELYERVHRENPNIGLVTVYRTIEILTKLELLCELHAGGSCHSYTISAPGHHHHMICSGCGAVVDFAGYDLANLEQKLSRETGFKIKDFLLEFTGLCRACQE
ncbi:Fur family transcriptional regulator [Chloroflexota bacterium]